MNLTGRCGPRKRRVRYRRLWCTAQWVRNWSSNGESLVPHHIRYRQKSCRTLSVCITLSVRSIDGRRKDNWTWRRNGVGEGRSEREAKYGAKKARLSQRILK